MPIRENLEGQEVIEDQFNHHERKVASTSRPLWIDLSLSPGCLVTKSKTVFVFSGGVGYRWYLPLEPRISDRDVSYAVGRCAAGGELAKCIVRRMCNKERSSIKLSSRHCQVECAKWSRLRQMATFLGSILDRDEIGNMGIWVQTGHNTTHKR